MFFLEDVPNYLANYPDSSIAQIVVSLMDPSNLWLIILFIISFYVIASVAIFIFAVGGIWECVLYATETDTRFWVNLFFNSKLYQFIQGFGTW